MASEKEAQDAILQRITEIAPNVNNESQARKVLFLAEAFAWLVVQGQPHGGTTVNSS